MILEAGEILGIAREELALGSGVKLEHLADARRRVDWDTFVTVVNRLSHLLGDDPERLRDFGRTMARAPANQFLQKIAPHVVSLRAFYIAGNRWVQPALFPGVKVTTEFLSDRLVRIEGRLAPSYRECLALFYIAEGNLAEMPRLMGKPPATIERSVVTPRSNITDLLLPAHDPLVARARRFLQAHVRAARGGAILTDQEREIQRGFDAITSATQEFRAVLERLPDAVLIHRGGEVLWVNQATATMLGHARPADLVGSQIASIVQESSRAVLVERMQTPVGDRSVPAATEARVVRKDGSILTVEVAPAELITFGGEPARLVIARDITERLRMQQRLMTADRLASMGLLAAGVAHEINNPLAYVLNNIEIASREIGRDPSSSSNARAALGTALQGVFRIRTIVHDLVTLSRTDPANIEAVDVAATLESTLALAQRELAGRVRIIRAYAPCPLAHANAARLGQVFLNLIVNAVDAMREESSANVLRLTTGSDARGRTIVEVTDNGVGIAHELLSRIFDPFYTTKLAGKGTGLGLAISHEIVSELGGELSVESVLGEGTTFRVALLPSSASV